MTQARIKLIPVQERHEEGIQLFASDAKVAATCNLPHPYPENGARQFIRYVHAPHMKGRRYTFAIEEGKEFRGICGVGSDDPDSVEAEVGYWIGLPFWGCGVATAATAQLIDFAFRKMRIERLIGRCLEENPASRKVLEKNGFRYVKTGPVQYAKWVEPRVTVFLEISREEWRKGRKRGVSSLTQ